jgi:hypothetical protein
MTRIVTTHYRYKPPPRKRKAVALDVPEIVQPKRKEAPLLTVEAIPSRLAVVRKTKPCNDNHSKQEPALLPNEEKKSAIVTVRRRGKRFSDVPDMTPEEHQRRGDAAAALFRELKRQIAGKDRP